MNIFKKERNSCLLKCNFKKLEGAVAVKFRRRSHDSCSCPISMVTMVNDVGSLKKGENLSCYLIAFDFYFCVCMRKRLLTTLRSDERPTFQGAIRCGSAKNKYVSVPVFRCNVRKLFPKTKCRIINNCLITPFF